MRELGRKGGLVSPQTRLRQTVDDQLREKARSVLERALAGEEVPKAALDSARSLFAYRPTEAPRQAAAAQEAAGATKIVGLGDVLRVAVEAGLITGENIRLGGQPVQRNAPLDSSGLLETDSESPSPEVPSAFAADDDRDSDEPLSSSAHRRPRHR
jgi:hypothetical protein